VCTGFMWIRLGTGYSRESLCSSSAILRFWGATLFGTVCMSWLNSRL